MMKAIARILLPVLIFVLTVFIMFSMAKARFIQMRHEAEIETEYQVNLFSEKVNRTLENADMLLRLTTVSVSGIGEINGNLPEGIERQTRNELILSPEIEFLSIIKPEGQIIWKSTEAPESGSGIYQGVIAEHIKKGLKFYISVYNSAGTKPDTIIFSRTAASETGVTAVIIIAVKAESLLHYSNDQNYQNTFYMGLLDQNFNILAETGSLNLPEYTIMDSDTSGEVTGGLKIEQGRDWVLARRQTSSFPFYTIVYSRFGNQIKQLRNNMVIISLIIITIYILIVLTVYIISQHRDKKNLKKINSNLSEQNKQRELLIKEVHHRVKNNLSMISSIIGLIIQNGGPFTEHTLENLSLRIDAISDIHERLYSSGSLNNIPLEEYISELVSNTLSAICCFEIELKIDIEPVTVSDKKAGYLGILLTEILTNAVKYGLKPESTLLIDGKKSGEHYTIIVENSGNPFNNEKRGLGSLLIDAMTAQLGAETVLNTSEATRYTIRFPLDTSTISG